MPLPRVGEQGAGGSRGAALDINRTPRTQGAFPSHLPSLRGCRGERDLAFECREPRRLRLEPLLHLL